MTGKTMKSTWNRSAWLDALNPATQPGRSRLSMQRTRELLPVAVMLTAVVLLLTACHTLPEKPCAQLSDPMMPALLQPLPPVSYSLQSQQSDENSQKKLTATSATSKP